MIRWLHDWLGRNCARHAAFMVIEAHIAEHPNEWERNSHWFWSDTKKLALWISNGFHYCELYDTASGAARINCPKIHTPMVWRRRFWRAANGCGVSDRRFVDLVDRFKEQRASATIIAFDKGTTV